MHKLKKLKKHIWSANMFVCFTVNTDTALCLLEIKVMDYSAEICFRMNDSISM